METTTKSGKGKKRWRWLIAGIVVIAVIGAGLFIASRVSSGAQAARVQTGDIVAAFTGNLDASATASGQIEAEQVARLSFETPSIVDSIWIAEGTHVNKGDALLRLDTADLELQLERAQQNVVLQEANLESLLEGPSASEIRSAEAAVTSAQAQLDQLLTGATEQDIAESEASIRQQLASLASASASYGSTRDSIADSAIAAAEADLVDAQIAYDHAKERNEDFAIS
ncbi:MAG: biotin/lipoyl-binding protein, partial [Candidatus Promineifilaceae bacterium]|nr:biotin/lipoyl-binding protein [Candidatus Promineifilaceae bacterium]